MKAKRRVILPHLDQCYDTLKIYFSPCQRTFLFIPPRFPLFCVKSIFIQPQPLFYGGFYTLVWYTCFLSDFRKSSKKVYDTLHFCVRTSLQFHFSCKYTLNLNSEY